MVVVGSGLMSSSYQTELAVKVDLSCIDVGVLTIFSPALKDLGLDLYVNWCFLCVCFCPALTKLALDLHVNFCLSVCLSVCLCFRSFFQGV